MDKIILFNPRSANSKHRIPNSILQVGASIHGLHEYVFVDGNMELNAYDKVLSYFQTGEYKYFCATVMPGPQLKEAVPISKKLKNKFPDCIIIWGGYFASNQHKVCIESGFVDYIINGPGDHCFPKLIDALKAKNKDILKDLNNLIYKDEEGNEIVNKRENLLNQDLLPPLPYGYLNEFYDLNHYLSKTFMGEKTFSYHSSMGCPFSCSFCAVVPIYGGRWKGKSAESIYKDVKYFKDKYAIDAIEFHDNNFFTSRNRVIEFSKLVLNDNISWWGEGRIDTIDKYSDEDLILMRKAGCTMIFLGAETGNDAVLKQMNKGGTQTGKMIEEFALRMKNVGIIPEFSFVLGMPAESPEKVYENIKWDINFIKKIKNINPDSEIIIYLYSPVPTEGSDLYRQIREAGFDFPINLEEWVSPSWEKFDLRKNPLTPWLSPKMINTIQDFESVLNGYYPTVSDFRVKGIKRTLLKAVSFLRYKIGFYKYPYEIKLIHKIWKYRQPEIQGFYSE